MKKRELEVLGHQIKLDAGDYICLTDIAKSKGSRQAKNIIQSWMKNNNTLRFLWHWEKLHNPNFKGIHLDAFVGKTTDNAYIFSPKKWIQEYNAVGIISKAGKGGGTFAHPDIALEFCSWLSPLFKVYILKEFRRLKEEESDRLNLQWHLSKITDRIDEARILLDTIPGQAKKYRRVKDEEE